jgi:hypothetical protein
VKLYRLEFATQNTEDAKSDSWRISYLTGLHWQVESSGRKESEKLFKNMRCDSAVLELGIDRESKPGINIVYYLVRDMWPEKTIEELRQRIEELELK